MGFLWCVSCGSSPRPLLLPTDRQTLRRPRPEMASDDEVKKEEEEEEEEGEAEDRMIWAGRHKTVVD